MKIAKIAYKNILGLEEFELTAGQVTIISGANGEGKSSCAKGLIAALGSGSQAKLLRNGTDEGEIVILFESGEKIRARVSADKGVTRTGWFEDGTEIPKLQTWLKERIDSVAFNIVKFLRGTPEERLEWVLKISPLKLEVETLKAKCPAAEIPIGSADGTQIKDPLKTIAALDSQMSERRTVLNREAKKKKTLAEQLETTLPSGSAEDCRTDLEDLRRRKKEVESERLIYAKAIDKAINESINETKGKLSSDIERLRLEAQAKIEAIRERLSTDISDLESAAQEALDETRRLAKLSQDSKAKEFAAREEPLIQDIARLEEVVQQQGKADTTRALIKSAKEEAREHETKSAALTKSLKALDEVRLSLFDKLPMAGLEIGPSGQLIVDGVDFETLNGANQVRVAFKLAKEASPGGIVCVDGFLAELDETHREHFEEWAKKSGLQMFCTSLSDGPLAVTTVK